MCCIQFHAIYKSFTSQTYFFLYVSHVDNGKTWCCFYSTDHSTSNLQRNSAIKTEVISVENQFQQLHIKWTCCQAWVWSGPIQYLTNCLQIQLNISTVCFFNIHIGTTCGPLPTNLGTAVRHYYQQYTMTYFITHTHVVCKIT